MLPVKTDGKWNELVTGKVHHNFKCVPAGLMISRHRRLLEMNNSKENIRNCIDEAYAFFQKYQSILRDDIKAIFGQKE